MNQTIWINSNLPGVDALLSQNLRYLLKQVNASERPLAFVCIGSANVCGDHLGPLIGTILSRHGLPHVYGTMHDPLNALTLPQYLPLLDRIKNYYCLIAIDAAIGTPAQSGYITLSQGPLYPGSAHHLPFSPVGDMHITGIFEQLNSAKSEWLTKVYCRQIAPPLIRNSYFPYKKKNPV